MKINSPNALERVKFNNRELLKTHYSNGKGTSKCCSR